MLAYWRYDYNAFYSLVIGHLVGNAWMWWPHYIAIVWSWSMRFQPAVMDRRRHLTCSSDLSQALIQRRLQWQLYYWERKILRNSNKNMSIVFINTFWSRDEVCGTAWYPDARNPTISSTIVTRMHKVLAYTHITKRSDEYNCNWIWRQYVGRDNFVQIGG